MDWRKAKTILILAFLLLDSFLAYQLWSIRGNELEFTQQVEGTSSSLQDMLKARDIELAVEIPSDMPEMHYLNVKYNDFSPSDLSRLSHLSIELKDTGLYARFIRPLTGTETISKGEIPRKLADQILFMEEYEVDPILSGPNRIVYVQKWDSYPFFGGILEFEVSDQKIWGYHQTRFEVVNKGPGKKVISSLTALRTLVENQAIRNGETIYSVQLGYYGHTFDAEIQVIAPVWRVIHGSRQVQVHYVNGITGVIEKIPSLPKKE